MKPKKNILIVSPAKIGLTETFIRAHIDQLYGNVFYLYGWDLDFKTQNGISLSEQYRPGSSFLTKLKSLLPHYIYFRLAQKRKKNHTKQALIKRYMQEHQIQQPQPHEIKFSAIVVRLTTACLKDINASRESEA